MDRAYRIGQSRPVTVHLPMAVLNGAGLAQGFDAKLQALLTRKRDLAEGLLAPAAGGAEEVERLFQDVVQQESVP